MRVAIRADGGPARGYGHLVRSGSLATELLDRGHSVVYLTATPETVRDYFPAAVEVAELAAPADSSECTQKLETQTVDAVFTDSYEVDSEYQRALSGSVDTVAVFQASDEYPLHCDILINSHLFASELEYDYTGEEPVWCLGLNYVLLREEFNRLAQREPLWRETPERALVIMGGSDVSNTTPEAIRAFHGYDLAVDVVIGPGYANGQEIEEAAGSVNCEFSLHQEPHNLAQLMFNADFAVSSLGTTVYELIATNTPIIGIPQVENQNKMARAIQKRSLGLIACSNANIRDGIEKYISDTTERKKIFQKYHSLVDGKGSQRVVRTCLTESFKIGN